MEYGLLTVEACVGFLMLLLTMYNQKNTAKNSTSVCFKTYVYSCIIYGVSVVLAIVLMKYTPISDGIGFKIIWRISYIMLLYTIAILYIYGFATVHKIKETNFFKMLFYNTDTKFIFAEALIVSILFCMPIHIKGVDFISKDNIIFINTRSALFMIGLLTIATLFYIIRIYKFRKEMTKEFITCDLVAFGIVIFTFAFHIFYHESSLMIFPLTVIAFILYYLIENPDIKLIDEAKKVNENLNGQNDKKIDLFQNINSDLINPINEMKMLCSHIKNAPDENEKMNRVQLLNKNGYKLLEDFENIFKNSIEYGNSANMNEYDTSEFIYNIQTYVENNLPDKSIKLVLNISPNLSKKYYGDNEKLYNAITNIISYSCSVIKLGRITISINTTKATDGEILTFKISDTSDGLTEEKLAKIFEENAELALSKKYISMMAGELNYTSNYRLGNTAIIRLKQIAADSTPLGDVTEFKQVSETQNEALDFTGKKVLIVDDDPKISKLTSRILSKYKLDIKTTNSSSECIDIIKLEEQFDIIFLDIVMSDIDGVETLHTLKELDGYKLPPIVALTANALSGMKEKYIKEGFDDFLAKPIIRKDLERILKKYLNK